MNPGYGSSASFGFAVEEEEGCGFGAGADEMEGAAENEREGCFEDEVDGAGPVEEEEEATEPGIVFWRGYVRRFSLRRGAHPSRGKGDPFVNSLMPKKSAAGAGGACSCFRLAAAATAGGSNMASFPFGALSAPASKTWSLEGPSAALGGATGAEGALLLFLGFGSMAASPVNGVGSPAAAVSDLSLLEEDCPAACAVVADGAGRSRRMRRFARVGGTGAGAGAAEGGESESESESEP